MQEGSISISDIAEVIGNNEDATSTIKNILGK